MWHEFLQELFSDAELQNPATIAEIDSVSSRIGIAFPTDLRDLYAETNGVYFKDAYMWIIWPLSELVKQNVYMHTWENVSFYEKSFTDLLFYGDLGNGDFLAFQRNPTNPESLSFGRWDHEDGEYREDGITLREALMRS